jgi:hypothetical protein
MKNMRLKYLFTAIALVSMLACKKEKSEIDQPAPPPPPDPVVQKILLKDIVIPNLPSPDYHFEYNTDSTIAVAAYASNFRTYHINYTRGKISEMKNTIQGADERVQYIYNNTAKVIAINEFDLLGQIFIKVFLTYDGNTLTKLERQRTANGNFVVNKEMSFTYYADGNLKEVISHYPEVPGQQQESTVSDRFSQYDNKINVDGFALLHNEFFDHLVLLPGVQLQKNNPIKEVVTTSVNSYEVEFTYTYNSKDLPLRRDGEGLITGGGTAGQRFQTHSVYSYYE